MSTEPRLHARRGRRPRPKPVSGQAPFGEAAPNNRPLRTAYQYGRLCVVVMSRTASRVLLPAHHQVGQPGVGLAIAQWLPVQPAGVEPTRHRHRHRRARVPLVLTAGVDVDVGLTQNDRGDLGARRPHRDHDPAHGLRDVIGHVRRAAPEDHDPGRSPSGWGGSTGGSPVESTTSRAGRATAPTTGAPPTDSATWTAQSDRPSSRNSRVPSSGSTIQRRPVARDVFEPLLGAHVDRRGRAGSAPPTSSWWASAIAGRPEITRPRRGAPQLQQRLPRQLGQVCGVAMLGSEVVGMATV